MKRWGRLGCLSVLVLLAFFVVMAVMAAFNTARMLGLGTHSATTSPVAPLTLTLADSPSAQAESLLAVTPAAADTNAQIVVQTGLPPANRPTATQTPLTSYFDQLTATFSAAHAVAVQTLTAWFAQATRSVQLYSTAVPPNFTKK